MLFGLVLDVMKDVARERLGITLEHLGANDREEEDAHSGTQVLVDAHGERRLTQGTPEVVQHHASDNGNTDCHDDHGRYDGAALALILLVLTLHFIFDVIEVLRVAEDLLVDEVVEVELAR